MTTALNISGLTKTYANGFQALKGIDFQVKQGDFFALLGPNGAGKSTTLGIVCGLVTKTAGQVSVFGVDLDTDFYKARQLLGVVPQEFNFHQFEAVKDVVATQAGYYGIPLKEAYRRSVQYLKALDLWDKRDVQARMLSGGMKRRLMIARALVHQPKLLILDEPTAGVDIELRRTMWDYLVELNQQGTTIILTTHYLEEAENLCKNIAIIDHGQIIQNTSVKELLTQLDQQTYILDFADPMNMDEHLGGFQSRWRDAHSMEVTLERSEHLNLVFNELSQRGWMVTSMRPKSNRLEELFVRLVKGDSAGKLEQMKAELDASTSLESPPT